MSHSTENRELELGDMGKMKNSTKRPAAVETDSYRSGTDRTGGGLTKRPTAHGGGKWGGGMTHEMSHRNEMDRYKSWGCRGRETHHVSHSITVKSCSYVI